MTPKNAIYAQSGGVTAVINASACAVIQTAAQYPKHIAKVFAAKNGILGALHEDLIDTSCMSETEVAKLMHTPAGAFGSCRYKLKSDTSEFQRLLEVFHAHDIGYFFYNGGGDSQDTANKVAELSRASGYPITCIGIPKTVDNDLPHTDCCPGFGSVAKYIAVSTREAALDIASMAATSTKVFILEVMGRHAGWIAAASALAGHHPHQAPHLILLPEVPFNADRFIEHVAQCVRTHGYCVVVASEGIRTPEGRFLSESGLKDAFGHAQLGGVAPLLAQMVQERLQMKYHWAVADYLQRAARHIASAVDLEQAYALGKHAVELAVQGKNALMASVVRLKDSPYTWALSEVELTQVANQERHIPPEFIRKDGFGITEACRQYLQPLIEGEAYPPYHLGIPDYLELQPVYVKKRLAAWEKNTSKEPT